jgi:NADPH:quinone reductase-like Zn-dependent oxidoreductase
MALLELQITPRARRAKSGLGQFLQISFAHAAALVFGLFLPTSDATVSTLAALSVYALGCAIIPQSNSSRGNEMTTQSSHANPILVTGAAGAVGSIGRNVTEMLLAKGYKVRALVRREDERAGALRQLGAEVMEGDLTDLTAMHRAIEGCARVYFGMSVSADYLTATVNTAAVARHHGVEAFVNMSQMTVTQMSITESTDSPQHKLHWLAEQACPGRASRSSPCGPRSSSTGSSGFSPPRACGTPTNWRCQWAAAKPRPSQLWTLRAPYP